MIEYKIKVFSYIFLILGIVTGIVLAIVSFANNLVGIGFTYLFTMPFGSYFIHLLLCGFSQLIENTRPKSITIKKTKQNTYQSVNNKNTIKEEYIDEINLPKNNECPICFAKMSTNDKKCKNCGYEFKKD